jgi:hypothetical protein
MTSTVACFNFRYVNTASPLINAPKDNEATRRRVRVAMTGRPDRRHHREMPGLPGLPHKSLLISQVASSTDARWGFEWGEEGQGNFGGRDTHTGMGHGKRSGKHRILFYSTGLVRGGALSRLVLCSWNQDGGATAEGAERHAHLDRLARVRSDLHLRTAVAEANRLHRHLR